MTQLIEQEKREIREQIKQEFYKHFNNVLNSPVLDEIYHTFDLISSNDVPCVYFVKGSNGFVGIGKTNNIFGDYRKILNKHKSYGNKEVTLERVILCPAHTIDEIQYKLQIHYKNEWRYGEWYEIAGYSDRYVGEITGEDHFYCDLNSIYIDLCEDYDFTGGRIVRTDLDNRLDEDYYWSINFRKHVSKEMYEQAISESVNDSLFCKMLVWLLFKKKKIAAYFTEDKKVKRQFVGDMEGEVYDMHRALMDKMIKLMENELE